jgi:ABC-type phosphate transport system permease subunit
VETKPAEASFLGAQTLGKTLAAGRAFQKLRERVIEFGMFLCAVSRSRLPPALSGSCSTSPGIFCNVSIVDFLTDTQWTVLFENPRYGIMPLVTGTLVTSGIALCGVAWNHNSGIPE